MVGDGIMQYKLFEYDADTGEHYWEKEFKTLEKALKYTQIYQKKNIVEYGLQIKL